MPEVINESAFDDDNLKSTIESDDKQEAPAPQAEDVPEKFKGKSVKEVAKMYDELEKVVGRQGNELGDLRRTYDEVLRSALTAKSDAPKGDSSSTESADDTEFFLNPREAIRKAVEENPLVKELRSKTTETQHERAKRSFTEKHPDHVDVLQDPGFQEWVESSPVRRELLLRAHNNFDVDAGDELFSNYKAIKGAVKAPSADKEPSDDVVRKDAVRAGKMPSGNAAPADNSGGKKVYRRVDLIRLKMTDPSRYEAMNDDITLAYQEGRVR